VQQAARRKRQRMQMSLGLFLLLLAGIAGLALSPIFAVQEIVVTGENGIHRAELLSGSGITRGDHLIAVDAAAARLALMAMPWVASAHVERKWPHTVIFSITEQRPSAIVKSAESLVLVSTTGRILQRVTKPDSSELLLELEGSTPLVAVGSPGSPDASTDPSRIGAKVSEEISQALGVLNRMPDTLRSELAAARLSRAGSLTMELNDGTQVLFGPPEDAAAKLLAVESVLNQVVRDCMQTLDVREPTRPAVSRGPGCAGISPGSSSAAKSSPSSSSPTAQSGTQSGSGGSNKN